MRLRLLLAALAALWSGQALAAEGSAAGCAALAAFADPQVTVSAAEAVGATDQAPAHCRVRATVSPVAGSRIGFELWLPLAGWNGKLQMYGNPFQKLRTTGISPSQRCATCRAGWQPARWRRAG